MIDFQQVAAAIDHHCRQYNMRPPIVIFNFATMSERERFKAYIIREAGETVPPPMDGGQRRSGVFLCAGISFQIATTERYADKKPRNIDAIMLDAQRAVRGNQPHEMMGILYELIEAWGGNRPADGFRFFELPKGQ